MLIQFDSTFWSLVLCVGNLDPLYIHLLGYLCCFCCNYFHFFVWWWWQLWWIAECQVVFTITFFFLSLFTFCHEIKEAEWWRRRSTVPCLFICLVFVCFLYRYKQHWIGKPGRPRRRLLGTVQVGLRMPSSPLDKITGLTIELQPQTREVCKRALMSRTRETTYIVEYNRGVSRQ